MRLVGYTLLHSFCLFREILPHTSALKLITKFAVTFLSKSLIVHQNYYFLPMNQCMPTSPLGKMSHQMCCMALSSLRGLPFTTPFFRTTHERDYHRTAGHVCVMLAYHAEPSVHRSPSFSFSVTSHKMLLWVSMCKLRARKEESSRMGHGYLEHLLIQLTYDFWLPWAPVIPARWWSAYAHSPL